MYGIDVAKWQGDINWKKVKASNKEFAILKVTKQNNSVEEAFEKNYAGASTNGISIGVYRYVYAKTVDQAKAEANAIVKVLNGRALSCGIWLDMEDASIKGIGKSNLTALINAEAYILQNAGYKVGIYCNKDWYYNVLDGKNLAKIYPFWIARYPSIDNGTVKKTLSPESYAKCWQYSSKGKVDGIAGNVDLNLAFVNLVKLMGGTAPKVEPVSNTSKTEYYPKYSGTSSSITIALASVGESDVTLSHRKKIANANGISSYSGTATQNTNLLKLLKNGKLIKV